MSNAQRYMHMHDAYFSPSTIGFLMKWRRNVIGTYTNCSTLIERIHIILHWIGISWIFEYRFTKSRSYSFPVTGVTVNNNSPKISTPRVIIY